MVFGMRKAISTHQTHAMLRNVTHLTLQSPPTCASTRRNNGSSPPLQRGIDATPALTAPPQKCAVTRRDWPVMLIYNQQPSQDPTNMPSRSSTLTLMSLTPCINVLAPQQAELFFRRKIVPKMTADLHTVTTNGALGCIPKSVQTTGAHDNMTHGECEVPPPSCKTMMN